METVEQFVWMWLVVPSICESLMHAMKKESYIGILSAIAENWNMELKKIMGSDSGFGRIKFDQMRFGRIVFGRMFFAAFNLNE